MRTLTLAIGLAFALTAPSAVRALSRADAVVCGERLLDFSTEFSARQWLDERVGQFLL